MVFSTRSMPRCCKQNSEKLVSDELVGEVVELSEWVSGVSELEEYRGTVFVSWYSRCELLLLKAGSWCTWIVREPRERGISAVENRYQKTGENTAGWEDLSVCPSEM
jgi:hypothetical protein